MKIKFSKIAALLLAGVVCLAPGCTDYQSDIDAIYSKIDKLADKESVSTLANQVNGLESTLKLLQAEAATHATKTELSNAVSALEAADAALGNRITSEVSKLQNSINGLDTRLQSLEKDLPVVKTNLENLTKSFNEYKTATDNTLEKLGQKDTELANAITNLETKLTNRVNSLSDALTKEVSDRAKADELLDGKITATKEELKKYIDEQDGKLKTAIEKLDQALKDEAAARETADKAEATARENGDKALSDAIAAEAKLRNAQDSVLAAAIAAEAAARANADSVLAAAIAQEVKDRDEAVKAEAAARALADTALSRRISALREDFEDLKSDYTTFKSTVNGEITTLKGRVQTLETKMKKMEEVTIPAIKKHIEDVDTLANQNKRHIQSVDDSLAAFKLATNTTLALMQDAISEIQTVNARQSDSLKAAFEKFNDYVLVTTFNAYRQLVQDSLALKLDVATFDAKMAVVDSTLAAHDLRLQAEEQYTNKLKTEIIPALEATDKALRSSIDSLCPIVAKLEARVDSIVAAIKVVNDTLDAHNTRILALQERVGVLEGKVDVLEDQVAELLARIQSVEFVPDYNDCKATINYIYVGGTFIDAESQITYKVYPEEMAANLVAAVEAMLNPAEDATEIPQIYFDVVKVKTRAEGEPGLQIISAKVSDRTKGAVEFTVKGQNVQDFYYPRNGQVLPFYPGNGQIIPVGPGAIVVPFYDNDAVPAVHQDYASCLVIEKNVRGNVLTSEYNVWAPNCTPLILEGFGTIEGEDFVAQTEYCQNIAFDNDTTVVTLWKPGVELYLSDEDGYMTVAETEAKYGIELPIVYNLTRSLYTKDANHDAPAAADAATAHKAVFTELNNNYANADSLKKGSEKLGDTAIERKATLGYFERATYTATIGLATVGVNNDLHVTKVQATADVNYSIYWQYSKDTATDAVYYAAKKKDEANCDQYTRVNVPIPADSIISDFAQRGLEAKDLEGAAAKLVSYSIKQDGAEVESGKAVLKVELNAAKDGYVFSFDQFKMNSKYEITAKYSLDAFDVNVTATINTYDRPKEPVSYTFAPKTFTYKKDLNGNYGVGQYLTKIYNDLKERYNADGHNHMDVDYATFKASLDTAAEWDLANIANEARPDNNYNAYISTAADGDVLLVFGYQLKYNDAHLDEDGDGIYRPGSFNCETFVHTFYGQEVKVDWLMNIVAPKYDFRHNTYYVYGKYEKDNSAIASYEPYTTSADVTVPFYTKVEPYYEAEKWNLTHFDVKKVNLPEAFSIVDENMAQLDTAGLGLVVDFKLANQVKEGENWVVKDYVPGANTDSRSNDETEPGFTVISIDEDYMLYYHGWDEEVPVYGSLAIKNSDGSKFEFPTSFDKDFEAVYAAKLTNDDDVKVGRYSDYQVVKFNPLHGFSAGEGEELAVTHAIKYYCPILTQLTLLDQRIYDPEDATSLDQTLCENGVNLFNGSAWKVGDDANGFASSVAANEAYDLSDSYDKEISGDVDVDIANKIQIVEKDGAPYLEFDYTQELHLTQPITVNVTASYIWPWVKEAQTATFPVVIRKTAVTD